MFRARHFASASRAGAPEREVPLESLISSRRVERNVHVRNRELLAFDHRARRLDHHARERVEALRAVRLAAVVEPRRARVHADAHRGLSLIHI